MASSGKKKTTYSKLARETRLRQRRADKQAKKDARKLTSPADVARYGEQFSESPVVPAGHEPTP